MTVAILLNYLHPAYNKDVKFNFYSNGTMKSADLIESLDNCSDAYAKYGMYKVDCFAVKNYSLEIAISLDDVLVEIIECEEYVTD